VAGLILAGALLGGVGFFLLGMRLITDGLKLAGGESLRRILEGWTRTPLRGVAAGALVTGLVQSSSAVTVAAIGFVNAGVLTLGPAVGVVFGSNVGTTMTSWIVAAVGVDVNVAAFALPLVGVGMALQLVGRGRRAALGGALAGFGVFFFGIELLGGAFKGIGEYVELAPATGVGMASLPLFVAIGFALTALTQSSSAALAMTLTAAAGGLIPLEEAAAATIGANLGTTSTAAIAVLGATPNARRVAAAHVLFNAVAALAALAVLPLLLVGTARFLGALGLDAGPATLLALFHTLFNLLGLALLLPFTPRLVRLLRGWFRTAEEDEASPRYLDRNVAATPALALEALRAELGRARGLAHRAGRLAIEGGPDARERVAAAALALRALLERVGEFTTDVRRGGLSEAMAERLPIALRVARYHAEVADCAEIVSALRARGGPLEAEALREALADYDRRVAALLDAADYEHYSTAEGDVALQEAEATYEDLKAQLLAAATRGEVEAKRLGDALDAISSLRRLTQQAEKGARHLAALGPV
jgi:phosphate:Na+ symporter